MQIKTFTNMTNGKATDLIVDGIRMQRDMIISGHLAGEVNVNSKYKVQWACNSYGFSILDNHVVSLIDIDSNQIIARGQFDQYDL